eukprot:Lankesteria_metandrocarpae@DN5832_c0_g1_i1.p1
MDKAAPAGRHGDPKPNTPRASAASLRTGTAAASPRKRRATLLNVSSGMGTGTDKKATIGGEAVVGINSVDELLMLTGGISSTSKASTRVTGTVGGTIVASEIKLHPKVKYMSLSRSPEDSLVYKRSMDVEWGVEVQRQISNQNAVQPRHCLEIVSGNTSHLTSTDDYNYYNTECTGGISSATRHRDLLLSHPVIRTVSSGTTTMATKATDGYSSELDELFERALKCLHSDSNRLQKHFVDTRICTAGTDDQTMERRPSSGGDNISIQTPPADSGSLCPPSSLLDNILKTHKKQEKAKTLILRALHVMTATGDVNSVWKDNVQTVEASQTLCADLNSTTASNIQNVSKKRKKKDSPDSVCTVENTKTNISTTEGDASAASLTR